MRWLLLLAIPLIAACDGEKVPDDPVLPEPPKVESSPIAAVAPATAKPEPDVQDAPVEIKIDLAPVTAVESEQLPSERVVPPPKPKPAVAAASKKKVEDVELPDPELDLSLPDDWSETLEPAEEATSMNLLPPLFESSKDSRLQLSGELLPGAAQDEAIIDGAQINFEIKR